MRILRSAHCTRISDAQRPLTSARPSSPANNQSPAHAGSSLITSAPPNRPLPPAVVLLSGGLDSATVLAIARHTGFACRTIAFDYGQRHRHELVAAEAVSRALGAADHRVVAIDLRSIGGSALTAEIDVPKDRPHQAISSGVPITYVPARNLIFLSIATGYAETIGARDLFIGVNAIDYSGYPDCRPEFIAAFERAASFGTAYRDARDDVRGVRIHAPLVDLTKAQIIARGTSLGVDYALTHSCYDPVLIHGRTLACGRCDSCVLRRDGFRAAGIPDPTRYDPNQSRAA